MKILILPTGGNIGRKTEEREYEPIEIPSVPEPAPAPTPVEPQKVPA